MTARMSETRYERLNNNQDEHHNSTRYDDIELNNGHGSAVDAEEHTTINNSSHHVCDVAANGGAATKNSRNVCLCGSRTMMQMAICTLCSILLYLMFSIYLTFYQKHIMKEYKFPLTIVCYHMLVKLGLAALVRTIYTWKTGRSRISLDWKTSLRKMGAVGFASGIDIGFSNWGLEFVSISLYTMTKSSTIVFILFFAILLGLEKKSLSLVFIVGLIAFGLFLFTYKSTQFDALGFIFILVASLSSGIRWSFAQFVMQKSKLGLHDPTDMIYHMQPWMIASLVPFLITFEGQKLYDVLRVLPNTQTNVMTAFLEISGGAALAFLLEMSEYLVLSRTSSLSLSIAGIFKDIFQLAIAVEYYGDQLSLINVLGLVVCLAGICCHLVHKYSMLTKLDELHALENDLQYNETNASGSMSTHHNNTAIENQRKHSAQTVPLLEQIDSDTDSNNDANEQSASEVIFDVLKRRDM